MNLVELIGAAAGSVYIAVMLILAGHGVHLLWLLRRYVVHARAARTEEAREAATPLPPDEDLPTVLVQLPVFNERDVVERLVTAIGALDWPRDRLRIQLLDDSTDDSVAIGRAAIAGLRERGFAAVALHRGDRVGYKAGALAAGMEVDDAPYIAIFDADFVPTPDFLRRAIVPLLADERLALVQGRWEHLNREENALTRAQAIGIDGHFAIEQAARAWSGLAMNFNGTCGLWRRAAIEAAGGWQHDTLTEDMDLSYRAQLAGWRCTYRSGLAVPGELPDTMEALRSQQFRWAKGSIQTARKLLPRVLASDWSWTRKLAACAHMTHYLVHPLMLLSLITAPAALTMSPYVPGWLLMAGLGLFVLGAGAPVAVYLAAQGLLGRRRGWRLAVDMPRIAAMGTGLAISNTTACWQALRGQVSGFVRTPKSGTGSGSYRASGRTGVPELLAAAWSATGIAIGFSLERPWVTPLLVIYCSGFGWVGMMYLMGAWRRARAASEGRDRALPRLALLALAGLAVYLTLGLLPGTWREAPGLFAGLGLAGGLVALLAGDVVRRLPAGPRSLAVILVAALAFRLAALGIAPSDDINRYVVEGRQVAFWQNPYVSAPASPETRALMAAQKVDPALVDGVNHPHWTAIYPPAALVVHALVTHVASTPLPLKVAAMVAELLALLLVCHLLVRRGRPVAFVVIAAWNPLGPIFAAGEGHHDPLMALALLAGVALAAGGARAGSLVATSLAALLKPFAAWALLPALRNAPWPAWLLPPALAVAAYLPFLGAGDGVVHSLGRFAHDLHFNAVLEPLLRHGFAAVLPAELVRAATLASLGTLLVGGSFWLIERARRRDDLADPALVGGLLALLFVCLPTLHPWYLLALVPFLPFLPGRALVVWTAVAPGYWLHGYAIQANGGAWAEDPLVRTLLHLPAAAVLLWEGGRHLFASSGQDLAPVPVALPVRR